VCLIAVAAAAPQRYTVSRPRNSVNLAARQLQNRGRQFSVSLDDSDERDIQLRGLGNFAAAQPGNAGGRFNVRLDDDDQDDLFDSRESDEIFVTSSANCPAGQLPHGNRCVVPRINRNIFVFGKDQPPAPKAIDQALIPLPEIDYNIIFVRSRPQRQKSPLVVPPPQKKTVVYVLEDEQESAEDVINIPAHPDADPEVYYVKVKPGENPQLPGGIDLQTAYSQAIRPLQGIRGDDSFESSIELTVGAGGFRQDVGVPLPTGNAGGAQFNSAGGFDAGFNPGSVGVPLPQGNAGQAPPAGGFQDVGVALPAFGGQDQGGFQDQDSSTLEMLVSTPPEISMLKSMTAELKSKPAAERLSNRPPDTTCPEQVKPLLLISTFV